MIFVLLLNVAAAIANGAAMASATTTGPMLLHGFAMVAFFVAAGINVMMLSEGHV